jgi:hypothetical protein
MMIGMMNESLLIGHGPLSFFNAWWTDMDKGQVGINVVIGAIVA